MSVPSVACLPFRRTSSCAPGASGFARPSSERSTGPRRRVAPAASTATRPALEISTKADSPATGAKSTSVSSNPCCGLGGLVGPGAGTPGPGVAAIGLESTEPEGDAAPVATGPGADATGPVGRGPLGGVVPQAATMSASVVAPHHPRPRRLIIPPGPSPASRARRSVRRAMSIVMAERRPAPVAGAPIAATPNGLPHGPVTAPGVPVGRRSRSG